VKGLGRRCAGCIL